MKISYLIYKYIGRLLPSRRLRRFIVSHMVKRCGKNVNIEYGARIYRDLEIGDYSGIGRNCVVGSSVVIGNYVVMGPECMFFTMTHNTDRIDVPMCRQGEMSTGKIVIGDDVWIGARVIFPHGNITVGNGTIIGSGSVVTKSVPDYAVVAGNPARIIRYRNIDDK